MKFFLLKYQHFKYNQYNFHVFEQTKWELNEKKKIETNTEMTEMIMNQMCYEVNATRLCHSEAWQRWHVRALPVGRSRSRTSLSRSRRAPRSDLLSCRRAEISRTTQNLLQSLCIWKIRHRSHRYLIVEIKNLNMLFL